MSFVARFRGRCATCDKPISVGAECAYVDDQVVHAGCVGVDPVSTHVETCSSCWMTIAANGSCGCDS